MEALSGLLFGVRPADSLSFGAVRLILGTVALAACALPAVRATGTQPVEALRQE